MGTATDDPPCKPPGIVERRPLLFHSFRTTWVCDKAKSQLPHSGILGDNQLAGPAQLLNPRSHPQTRHGPLGVALRAGLRAAALCPNALQASKQEREREREKENVDSDSVPAKGGVGRSRCFFAQPCRKKKKSTKKKKEERARARGVTRRKFNDRSRQHRLGSQRVSTAEKICPCYNPQSRRAPSEVAAWDGTKERRTYSKQKFIACSETGREGDRGGSAKAQVVRTATPKREKGHISASDLSFCLGIATYG